VCFEDPHQAILLGKQIIPENRAIDIADLQASQLCIPNASRVESHEHGSIKSSRSGVDGLRYLFLTENGGQTVTFLGIGSVGNTPRLLQRLEIEKPQGTDGWSWYRATASAP